jgi:hypothetical protein
MRRIVITLAVAIVSVLAGAGTAAPAGASQAPQDSTLTFLINCPNLAPFLVTSPPGLFATVGVGHPVVVAPQGFFHGRMPEDLLMTCSITNVATGNTVEGQILLAPPPR